MQSLLTLLYAFVCIASAIALPTPSVEIATNAVEPRAPVMVNGRPVSQHKIPIPHHDMSFNFTLPNDNKYRPVASPTGIALSVTAPLRHYGSYSLTDRLFKNRHISEDHTRPKNLTKPGVEENAIGKAEPRAPCMYNGRPVIMKGNDTSRCENRFVAATPIHERPPPLAMLRR